MNWIGRTWSAVRKGLENLGGGPPYGTPVDAGLPRFIGWGFDYPDALLEAWARGASTVASCIDVIATRLSEPPLVIEKKVGLRKWERLEDDSPEFGKVAQVLARPNDLEGPTALWKRFYASHATFGVSPLLTDYLNFGKQVQPGRTPPRELRVLYSPNLTPVFDGQVARPVRFNYQEPVTGKLAALRPDEIFYHVNPRLDDPWRGSSLVARAAVFAVLMREMGKYHIGYFKNGARAGVVLESDQKIGPEQMKKLRAEWQEEYGTLEGKAFRTWFLHSGFKLKDLGDGQKDADFPNLFRLSKEEVGAAFGVPPVFMADYSNAALANIEQQTPILYEGRLMPDGRMACENLSAIVGPRFDPSGRIRFRLDWDSVPAIKRIAWNHAKTFIALTGVPILTVNEAREMNYLPPVTDGDVLFVPFSVSPLSTASKPAAPLPEAQPPKVSEPQPGKAVSLEKWIESSERNIKRGRADASQMRFVPQADRELRAFLDRQESRLIAALPKALKSAKAAATKGIGDDGFDDEFEAEAMAQVIMKIYLRVAGARGPEAAAEVGGSESDFLVDAPAVRSFIEQQGYRNGKLITGTTADRLRTILADAIDQGLTLQEITTQVRAAFDVRRSEALRIARTEVNRGFNFATAEAWRATNTVEAQEWLTAHDDLVRDSHAAQDGAEAAFGELFPNGCAYPGDPDAPPDETINCLVDPSTPVRVPGGSKRVAEIEVGDLVLTHRGRYRRVVRVRSQDPYSGALVTLWTRHGKVSVTAGHPLHGLSGWNRADALRLGDCVQVLCPSADIEGAKFRHNGIAHLPDRFLCGCVPNVALVDRGEESHQLGAATLDAQVWEEEVRAEPTCPGRGLEAMDRHPVGAPVGGPGFVHESKPQSLAHPTQDFEVAVGQEAAHDPARGASGFADREASVGIEEPGDVGEMHFGDCHKPMIVSWAEIVKIEYRIAHAVRVFNFAVEEDESYIASDFISHNCRCTLLPVLKGSGARAYQIAPELAKLFDKK